MTVCSLRGAIYWQSDMDIDCDGGRTAVCRSDPSYLPDTSATTSGGELVAGAGSLHAATRRQGSAQAARGRKDVRSRMAAIVQCSGAFVRAE